MKNNSANIQILRANSLDSAMRRGKKTAAGAFAKTGKAGENMKGDTSTRGALSRIWMAGETLLRNALLAVKRTVAVSGWSVEPEQVEVPLLPGNWGGAQSVHNLDGGQSWKGWFSMPASVFENAARCAGWMKAMATLIEEHPNWFLRAAKALAKNPKRGMNSPSNNCWHMVAWLQGSSVNRWRTPGHAFRAVSAGISRAKVILRGFNVENIPWSVVMEELASPRGPQRGNKLGRRLALKTLSQLTGVQTSNRATAFVQFKGFRHDAWRAMAPEARAFYQMRMREGSCFENIVLPLVRNDDGVMMFTISENTVRLHRIVEGFSIETGYKQRPGESYSVNLRKQTVVINQDGRSFHLPWFPSEVSADSVVGISGSSWSTWGQGGNYHTGCMSVPADHESVGINLSGSTKFWQRFAVRFAQKAWLVQDATAKAEGLELPDDCTILVWLTDSYAAGNCEEGTRAFKDRNGWSNRLFVPIQWLLDKELRARNAAKVALARYWADRAVKAA